MLKKKNRTLEYLKFNHASVPIKESTGGKSIASLLRIKNDLVKSSLIESSHNDNKRSGKNIANLLRLKHKIKNN